MGETGEKEKSDKRSEFFSQKHDVKAEDEKREYKGVKRGRGESLNHLTQRAKKKAGKEEAPQPDSQKQTSLHSKEEVEKEQKKKKREPERSPEERELQMIARRTPEEREVMEEEGSATRKSEVGFALIKHMLH